MNLSIGQLQLQLNCMKLSTLNGTHFLFILGDLYFSGKIVQIFQKVWFSLHFFTLCSQCIKVYYCSLIKEYPLMKECPPPTFNLAQFLV